MKVSIILLSLLICVATIAYVEGKGLILPHGMKQADYCKGCIATIDEIGKKKKEGKSAKKIIANIKAMCSKLDGENNRTTCLHLFEHHEDDLHKIVDEVDDLQRMKTWFCHEHSFACIGVKTNFQNRQHLTDEELLKTVYKVPGERRMPHPVRATDEL